MTVMEVGNVAALLGVKSKKAKPVTTLDLADAVGRGLPVASIDTISDLIAPGNTTFRYHIVPKATLMRRRKAHNRLTAAEGDRVARLVRLWAFALDVWGTPEAARRFLGEPHPLLGDRPPREVAVATQFGALAVEQLLGRLKYGTAV